MSITTDEDMELKGRPFGQHQVLQHATAEEVLGLLLSINNPIKKMVDGSYQYYFEGPYGHVSVFVKPTDTVQSRLGTICVPEIVTITI